MGAVALKAGHSKGIEFLPDALGTVRDIVDDTGTVIQSYEFNEHGIPMPGSGAGTGTFSPKTYQGGLSVNDDRNDSGLYLMGHRHYAADLGRFISRDPIGFQGGLNLFNGAGTSPVTFVDPEGLEVRAVFDIATGTLTITSTEGDQLTYTGIKCGPKNDPKDFLREGSSTPPGTYYLGDPINVGPYRPLLRGDLMWVPLLNTETLSNHHWNTDPVTGEERYRDEFYLHPGTRSDGCLTFPSTGRNGLLEHEGVTKIKELLAKTKRIQVPFPTVRFTPTGPVMENQTVPGILIVK